jgi:hypothetical protein
VIFVAGSSCFGIRGGGRRDTAGRRRGNESPPRRLAGRDSPHVDSKRQWIPGCSDTSRHPGTQHAARGGFGFDLSTPKTRQVWNWAANEDTISGGLGLASE